MAATFYAAMFGLENVGQGVLEARKAAESQGRASLDLSAFSLVFYGDSGGAQRRDLHTAA